MSEVDGGDALGPVEPVAAAPRREVAVVERSSNIICHTSGSSSSTLSGPHVWAYLLDNLLHEIIALFGSFHDFVAFACTCHSWRNSVSSFASVYAFGFPPLHLKPDVSFSPWQHDDRAHYMLLADCKWKISDPAKRDMTLRCSVPQNTPEQMLYMGSSYGYLIFFYRGHSLLINVYTATVVKPPILSCDYHFDIYCGIVMTPRNSAKLHILLFSKTTMYEWQLGTDNSWSEHRLGLDGERLEQIVFFRGDMFAVDIVGSVFIIRFGPQLSMQRVPTVWSRAISVVVPPWLVVCGDMLLVVGLKLSFGQSRGLSNMSGTFHVFRLDISVEPARLVEMEKLENHALFISLDRRNRTFSCSRPERWGGKSNCIYVARQLEESDVPWTAVEIGQPVSNKTEWILNGSPSHPPEFSVHCSKLEGLWMLPNFVCGAGQ